MDQIQNRRIAAVKAADAINAIEGVPVSDYAKTLSACWGKPFRAGNAISAASRNTRICRRTAETTSRLGDP